MERLFQDLKEGLTLITRSRHKATQCSYSSGQAQNFFSIRGWLHAEHDFYLVWICLFSAAVDYDTQELSCGDSESTLDWV